MADRQAAARARELLTSLLDGRQLLDLQEHRGFRLRSADRLYWIPLQGKPSSVRLSDGLVENYCVDVDRREGMPRADVALTHLLWLRADPDTFHDRANVIGRSRLRGSLDEDAVMACLIARYQPAPPRLRRPTTARRLHQPVPCYPSVQLTDGERVAIADRLRGLRVDFKAAALRQRLSGYSDELIRGLATRLIESRSTSFQESEATNHGSMVDVC